VRRAQPGADAIPGSAGFSPVQREIACRPPGPFGGILSEPAGDRSWKMLEAYIPVLLFILVAIGFAVVALVFAALVRPARYNKVKFEPYECGIETRGDARDRYSIRYYIVAMLFVVFDVETVFMFPWAVIMDRLALFGLIEMIVFLFILIVGYAYAWKQGALEWV
jgi:NADH-quinone oxidoreductase subunit A